MRGGFRSDLLYQLQYGHHPLVLGVGLAAVRDLVSFFRYETQDAQGTHNPIAGQVQHTIGLGISQSGNLVRTFLNLGFNEDEQGRRVWEGAMPIIAARQTPMSRARNMAASAGSTGWRSSQGALLVPVRSSLSPALCRPIRIR